MSDLNEYLEQKREAIAQRPAKAQAGGTAPHGIQARVQAAGRSGIRRIRIRGLQVISDSGPDFAGYDLGPSSPELQLGVLGSCITHVFLIQAAERGVPLNPLEVEVAGQLNPRAGRPGFEHIPVYPHNISYTVHIDSPVSDAELAELHQAVERVCPILNLLVNPQEIKGTVMHSTERATVASTAG